MSDSVRPHRKQPTRLPRPWDSPGKNTGVGCHFLLQCMKVKKVKVKLLSDVQPSATPWTAAFQAPPSMGFSRQEYWSGVPLPSPPEHTLWATLLSPYTLLPKKTQSTLLHEEVLILCILQISVFTFHRIFKMLDCDCQRTYFD